MSLTEFEKRILPDHQALANLRNVLDTEWSKFEKAAEDVKNLKSKPTDAELLEVYALFKQATVGDVNTNRAGMFDFKGKSKWDAWNSKKGMAQSEAQEAYIRKANTLIEIYGLK